MKSDNAPDFETGVSAQGSNVKIVTMSGHFVASPTAVNSNTQTEMQTQTQTATQTDSEKTDNSKNTNAAKNMSYDVFGGALCGWCGILAGFAGKGACGGFA